MTGPETPLDEDDPRIDAAEYALGLLAAPAAEAFEARMGRDPVLRQDYAAWCEYLSALTDDLVPQVPPAQVWNRIQAAIAPAAPRGFLRQLRPLTYLLGGILAAMLAWAVFTFGLLDGGAAPQWRAEIAGAGDVRVVAEFTPATGGLVIDHQAGAPDPGRVFELWLLEPGATPVSLGVLPQEAGRSFVVLNETQVAGLGEAMLAISVEPPGGSPAIVPTGPVVALGPLVAL